MMAETARPDDLLTACREVGRAMDLFDEAAARALGVGRSDLRALNLLEDGPLAPSVLAARLGLSRASITALVDRLTTAGYLGRAPDPGDRRGVLVELREPTWRAFAGVYAPLGERVRAATGPLPADERRVVVAALDRIVGAFDDARQHLAHGDGADV